jgi:excisionase family DNA binding protein
VARRRKRGRVAGELCPIFRFFTRDIPENRIKPDSCKKSDLGETGRKPLPSSGLRFDVQESDSIRFGPVCGLHRARRDKRRVRLSARRRKLGGQTVTATTPPPVEAALLDVRAVAVLLDCSSRHVYRLADAGRMPAPVRVGALVRWRRADLDSWLAAGCPSTLRRSRD